MTKFVEFTYKDKNNKNMTAYYNAKEGTLRVKEYKQSDDDFYMSKLSILFIWVMLLFYGVLSIASILFFKQMFIGGDLLWLVTFTDLILIYCVFESVAMSSMISTEEKIQDMSIIYNSIEKMQDILKRHEDYNKLKMEPNIFKQIPKVAFIITTVIIGYTLITDGKAHLILFLINFISGVLSQIHIALSSREPSKILRDQIKLGEILISNERPTY